MKELDAGRGEPTRVTELGKRDEGACDLRRRVEPFRRIDPNAEASNE
jgi:hypothetical protein